MIEDPYDLNKMSDSELHDWIVANKPGTAEYAAGVRESMRRVAYLEGKMEEAEAPVRKRELIAAAVAIVSIVVAIVATVLLS